MRKQSIGYIPWLNGQPNLPQEEWEQALQSIGYSVIGECSHNTETGKVKALVTYPEELEETVKNSPSFEWVEDVEEDSEEV